MTSPGMGGTCATDHGWAARADLTPSLEGEARRQKGKARDRRAAWVRGVAAKNSTAEPERGHFYPMADFSRHGTAYKAAPGDLGAPTLTP